LEREKGLWSGQRELLLSDLCAAGSENGMRWMSIWARSSLYWVVYEKDYAGARHPLMQLIWLYQENTFPTGEVVSVSGL